MNITPEMLQAKEDMLEFATDQRNAAQNECLQLAAQVRDAVRIIQKREARIIELEAQVKDLEAKLVPPSVAEDAAA